jgi:plastocyanin domain-containing protein
MLIGDKMVVQCGCHAKRCMKAETMVALGCGDFGVKYVEVEVDVHGMQPRRIVVKTESSKHLESLLDAGNQLHSSSSSSSSFFPQFHTSQMCS